MTNLKKILLFGALGLSLFLYMGFYHSASSNVNQNLSGFAWGAYDNQGLGWISFNAISDPDNIPGVDYGVNINNTTKDITGYAWSPHYGWLKFGGLSGFPTGGGTTTANAKLVGNKITGWARFCAGAQNSSTCVGTNSDTKNGGWDGWVSLSGTNYGVTLNTTTGAMSGYAWGGDDNGKNFVGWIDFSKVVYTLPDQCPPGYTLLEGGTPPDDCKKDIITGSVCPTGYTLLEGGTAPDDCSTSITIWAVPNSVSSTSPTTTLLWKSPTDLSECVAKTFDNSGNITPSWEQDLDDIVANTTYSKSNVSVPSNPTYYKITCSDSSDNDVTATTDPVTIYPFTPQCPPGQILLPGGTAPGDCYTPVSCTELEYNTEGSSCYCSLSIHWQEPVCKNLCLADPSECPRPQPIIIET